MWRAVVGVARVQASICQLPAVCVREAYGPLTFGEVRASAQPRLVLGADAGTTGSAGDGSGDVVRL